MTYPRGITHPKARPLVGALVGALVGVLVIGFGVLTVKTYDAAESSEASLVLIRDCLSPDGYCARARKEANEEQAVVLTRVTVFAAACAKQPQRQTAKDIEKCVKRLLHRAALTPAD